MIKRVVVFVLVVGIVAVAYTSGCKRERVDVDPNAYYSVLLANNSTFFGHIKSVGRRNFVMSDVHYVRRTPLPNDATKFNLTLVARKDDAHGPGDELNINRRNVFMYEKLRDDSRILDLIKWQKAQPAAAATSDTPVAPAPTPSPPVQPAVPAANE